MVNATLYVFELLFARPKQNQTHQHPIRYIHSASSSSTSHTLQNLSLFHCQPSTTNIQTVKGKESASFNISDEVRTLFSEEYRLFPSISQHRLARPGKQTNVELYTSTYNTSLKNRIYKYLCNHVFNCELPG